MEELLLFSSETLVQIHPKSSNPGEADPCEVLCSSSCWLTSQNPSVSITSICPAPYGGHQQAQYRVTDMGQAMQQSELAAHSSDMVQAAEHKSQQEKHGIHSGFPLEELSEALKCLLTKAVNTQQHRTSSFVHSGERKYSYPCYRAQRTETKPPCIEYWLPSAASWYKVEGKQEFKQQNCLPGGKLMLQR